MRIGDYETESLLARGGYGSVHVARHVRLRDRVVAVKLVATTSTTRAERAVREAETLARLDHPNVVAVHDAGLTDDGHSFIVMELIRGPTLEAELQSGAPRERLLDHLADAARGVAFAHERGVVHRDLKPANILIATSGAKVCDFGIARQIDRETVLTASGEMIGTLVYMSPEQVHTAKVAAPADVYALGAILYHILAGRPPHDAQSPIDLLRMVAEAKVEPPSRVAGARVPAALEALCLRALARDPSARPRDAGVFLAELEVARRAAASGAAPARSVAAAVALLAVGVVAFGAAVVLGRSPPAGTGGVASTRSATATDGRRKPPEARADEPAWYAARLERALRVAPRWFAETPAEDRPAALPEGVVYLRGAGEYLNVADGSVLVWVPKASCFLGAREVTVEQFDRFVARNPADAPAHERPASRTAADAPVRFVDWTDATRYARRADATLPTWLQWRAGCRLTGAASPGWDKERGVLVLGAIEKRGATGPAAGATGGIVTAEWCSEGAPDDPDARLAARSYFDIGLGAFSTQSVVFEARQARDDLTFRICRPGADR